MSFGSDLKMRSSSSFFKGLWLEIAQNLISWFTAALPPIFAYMVQDIRVHCTFASEASVVACTAQKGEINGFFPSSNCIGCGCTNILNPTSPSISIALAVDGGAQP
jgi:hypothetical protein